MANSNRMEELVQRIEADAALRAELEQAASRDAARAVLDRNGFGDITLTDAQAYARQTMPELSDEALEQIAGGDTVQAGLGGAVGGMLVVTGPAVVGFGVGMGAAAAAG